MRSIASLPCEIVLGDLKQLLKSFYYQGFFPQNGGLLSVLSIPAIRTIIRRCFLGLCEVCTFVVEKRRYIMKLVVEFLMSICHGVVVFVSCIGKLPRKLWRFNKKHHCISYDNNSIDSLYDWDDDDDF